MCKILTLAMIVLSPLSVFLMFMAIFVAWTQPEPLNIRILVSVVMPLGAAVMTKRPPQAPGFIHGERVQDNPSP